MFVTISDPNFQETGSEQVFQVLIVSLTLARYAKKEPCVRNFFYIFSRAALLFTTLINGGQFLQTDLSSAHLGALATLYITAVSVLEAHTFFSV